MINHNFNIGIGRDWEFLVEKTDTDVSTALQAAHDLAAAKKGVVILPPHEFNYSAKLALNPTVEIQGSGQRDTKLIKTGTGAAMEYINTATVYARPKPIHNFWLEGNNGAGSIALNFRGVAGFDFNNLIITKFETPIVLTAGLMGDIAQCEITYNVNGIKGVLATQTTDGLMQSNHVRLRSVFFARNTGISLDWDNAALISLFGCGFEYNGVNGNANTGCMRFTNASRSNEGIGFALEHTWLERNWGTLFNLGEAVGDTVHMVNNSLIAYNEECSNVALITGVNKNNTLRFNNTPVHTNGVATININGALAKVEYANYGTTTTPPPTEEPTDDYSANLFLSPEEIDNAIWAKTRISVNPNVATNQFSFLYADKIIPTATAGQHYINQNITKTAEVKEYKLELVLMAEGYLKITVDMAAGANGIFQSFTIGGNGSVDTSGQNGTGFTIVGTPTLIGVANGYKLLTINVQTTATTSLETYLSVLTDAGANSFTGDGASGVLISSMSIKERLTAVA